MKTKAGSSEESKRSMIYQRLFVRDDRSCNREEEQSFNQGPGGERIYARPRRLRAGAAELRTTHQLCRTGISSRVVGHAQRHHMKSQWATVSKRAPAPLSTMRAYGV